MGLIFKIFSCGTKVCLLTINRLVLKEKEEGINKEEKEIVCVCVRGGCVGVFELERKRERERKEGRKGLKDALLKKHDLTFF